MNPKKFHSRYVPERLIGEGGQGVVYLGRNTVTHERVALKYFAKSEFDPARMNREVMAMKSLTGNDLHSPAFYAHTVKGYWVEEAKTWAEAAIACQVINGRTMLSESIRNRYPLEKHEIIRYIGATIDISETLDYAHSRGVIHRDIKPDNQLIDRDGHGWLIDWGCTRETDNLGDILEPLFPERLLCLTPQGETYGTIGWEDPDTGIYTLPQRLHDTWGLAATLYHTISGHHPYSGLPDEEKDATIFARLRDEDPDPVRMHNPAIPTILETFLELFLASKIMERPESDCFTEGLHTIYKELSILRIPMTTTPVVNKGTVYTIL